MAEANLQSAATNAYTHLYTQFKNGGGSLRASLLTFQQQGIGSFPAAVGTDPINNQPVAYWLALAASLAWELGTAAPGDAPTPIFLERAAQIVYRACWIGSYLQSTGKIANAQATALLAAYNTAFP